jgi:hypothetical protein
MYLACTFPGPFIYLRYTRGRLSAGVGIAHTWRISGASWRYSAILQLVGDLPMGDPFSARFSVVGRQPVFRPYWGRSGKRRPERSPSGLRPAQSRTRQLARLSPNRRDPYSRSRPSHGGGPLTAASHERRGPGRTGGALVVPADTVAALAGRPCQRPALPRTGGGVGVPAVRRRRGRVVLARVGGARPLAGPCSRCREHSPDRGGHAEHPYGGGQQPLPVRAIDSRAAPGSR